MALPETLACFRLLMAAYPDKKPEADTFQLYAEMLADIPVYLLEAAIREHIAGSPWFPKLSELRDATRRISGCRSFDSLPPRPVDYLGAKFLELETIWYHERILDVDAWEHLAEQLERANRPHRAQAAREKLRRFNAICDEEEVKEAAAQAHVGV